MILEWILIMLFVIFVVLPILFHYENKQHRKSKQFDQHVEDAMGIADPD